MRVNIEELPTKNWHHFLRLRDLRQILTSIDTAGVNCVLELGAGDGIQTDALRKIFPVVVPVDIAPSGDVEGMVIADVAKLPFEDASFDLIFSSNLLEHVENLDAAFSEMKRVLAPGGVMIHSMPTSVWKFSQLILRPVASIFRITRSIMPLPPVTQPRAQQGSHGMLEGLTPTKRSIAKKIVGTLIPTIHGVSGNHVTELLHFRPIWWHRRFENSGFAVDYSLPLYFHSPYDLLPYRFLKLRDFLSRNGMASVYAFVLRDLRNTSCD